MKKKVNLLLTFMLVVLYNLAYSQCKSDLEKEKIKGNVKKIVETAINVKDGKNEINHIKITTYDNTGKSLGYTFAHKNYELKPTKIIYEFDKKGNKERENRLDLNDKIKNYLTFKYDSRGNIIKESYFFSDGRLDSYSLFKYNSTCDKIETKTFFSDGDLWFWYKFSYEDGKLIEFFDLQDSTSSKFINDIQNNNIKYIKYDKFGDEKKSNIYTFEYDDKSNWTKKTHYENGEIYWIEERQYEYQ